MKTDRKIMIVMTDCTPKKLYRLGNDSAKTYEPHSLIAIQNSYHPRRPPFHNCDSVATEYSIQNLYVPEGDLYRSAARQNVLVSLEMYTYGIIASIVMFFGLVVT